MNDHAHSVSSGGASAASVEPRSYLARSTWFTGLPEDLQQLAMRGFRVKVHTRGSLIARRNECPAEWMGVIRGALKASVTSADGRVSSYVLARQMQWVDSEELVQESARPHDVVALTDSVVVVLDAGIFKTLLSNVIFCRFVLRQISQQHSRLLERIGRERSLSTSSLVAQTVAELANELSKSGGMTVALRQEEIAEFVGLTRQTVNQILKKLEADRLLATRYSRVEVLDLFALEKFNAGPSIKR